MDLKSTTIKAVTKSVGIHVDIFSEHYVESKWCFDALDSILGSICKVTIVFYDIKPMNLRYINK